jgi:5-methylcytosine-specific restriction endonuclease McrA
MKKLKSIKTLKTKADKVFSLWIRNREPYCYTCGSKKNLQAGHFVSRSYLFLRYEPDNVHTQCVSCNVFKNGNMAVYALRLTDQYGEYILREFERNKRKSVANTRLFLEGIIKRYG